ncbi:MAG: UDP-N-acetylmuramoyl-tripeptide--D-alanyl-D-alanine ligase [Clostridiales bacterium]|nr:UDP-N-acetylmuramoyl-tripeptide--D-alanyl-D-alanine ligase [Clostridiales bacterium]
MEYYISVGLIAVAAVLSCLISLPMMKIIQLSGYKARGVVSWWKGSGYDVIIRYAALMLFGFISMIVYVGCFSAFEYVRYCAVALYDLLAAIFVFSAGRSGSNGVKPTGRVIRLIIVDFVLTLVLCAGVAWASYYSEYCQTLAAALAMLAPFVALAANVITKPFERLNNRKYVKRAKAKLSDKAPIVIGITGSFGKTTAKNLLKGMLAQKYSVLATPGSFNTPMGVCKTVNNELNDEQYFIAELGARYKGDIKELCDIVSPKYGIITAIGDMHIETMGSRANVANVKFELGTALPEDGLLVLNGYNEDCKALNERATSCKKVTVGEGGSVAYDNLKISGNGTSFDLVIDEKRYPVTVKLLGAHIAELVCACAAVANACGITAEQIVSSVEAAPPVEHRLQLVPSVDPSVTVIDDAYNSNPIGAKNALDVLACFEGKKIIITPGFVELGSIEKECNIALGKQIAGVCDYAYFVGTRAKELKKGALAAGMIEGTISEFSSRDEAVQALKDIGGEKVVLFENDLPDNIK